MWTQAEALWRARLEGRFYLLSQMSETLSCMRYQGRSLQTDRLKTERRKRPDGEVSRGRHTGCALVLDEREYRCLAGAEGKH